MTRYSLLLVVLLLAPGASAETVRAVDEAGNPIEKFEAMYHTADQGYSHWESSHKGACQLHLFFGEPTPVDVLVRADGYATSIKRLGSVKAKQLNGDPIEVTLTKGHPVKIRLEIPDGLKFADDFVLEAYFPQFAGRARMMWQPGNKRGEEHPLDVLNLQAEGDGTFALNLPDEETSFLIGIDEPGTLRFCELGPFTKKDFLGGTLTVKVRRPAPIEVRLETRDADPDALPFDKATCTIMWKNPDGPSNSWYSATDDQAELSNGVYRVGDLAPGEYMVQVRTAPKEADPKDDGSKPNPGRFFDQDEIKTDAGDDATVSFT